jgi:hypothetical protein
MSPSESSTGITEWHVRRTDLGLMDGMMDRMIKNMSVEEKEEMMLKMMPAMMERVDINKTVPGMMAAMGRLITATGSVVLISKALNDDELKEELGGLLINLREKSPRLAEMMPMMMAFMFETGLMDGMMKGMGKVMPVMMPMMREMMPTMMKETMPGVMAKHDDVRKSMSEMMMNDIIPHCVDTMLPTFAPEKSSEFLPQLAERVGRAANQGIAPGEDRENLEKELVGQFKAGFGAKTY